MVWPITYHLSPSLSPSSASKRTWLMGLSGENACRYGSHNHHLAIKDGHILPRLRITLASKKIPKHTNNYRTAHPILPMQANQHMKILTASTFRQNPGAKSSILQNLLLEYIFFVNYIQNIAKGTTDPRVEFILPEGWVHLAKVPSWGRITSSTAVMWTRTGNLTNYTSKNPLQVASGPHPLRRARGLSKELVPNVQLWMKHQALPSHTRPIKFTKQEWVSESVSEWQALPMIGLGSDKNRFLWNSCSVSSPPQHLQLPEWEYFERRLQTL